jgi:hypothetical protein
MSLTYDVNAPQGTLSSQQAGNDVETSHNGTLSPPPVAAHISVKTHDDSRVVPAPRESLLALNLPDNDGITSNLTSSCRFSIPIHPLLCFSKVFTAVLNPREVQRPLRNVLTFDGEPGQRVLLGSSPSSMPFSPGS